MKCNQAERLLSEYIDNRLSARNTWELERHLSGCSSCSRSVADLRRTVLSIATAPRAEVSSDFASSLQARLREVQPAPARQAWLAGLRDLMKPRLNPAFGAACAAVLLVVVVGVLPRTPQDIDPVPMPAGNSQAAARTTASNSLATAAGDPFEDLAASNLAALASNSSAAR